MGKDQNPAAGTISWHELYDLLMTLHHPFGLGGFMDEADIAWFTGQLVIPVVGGRVRFNTCLLQLVQRCSYADIPEGAQHLCSNCRLRIRRVTCSAPCSSDCTM